jgi:hypothetical protein
MGKKYTDLYNRIFGALHADDKFVATSPLDHDALIDAMASAMAWAAPAGEVCRNRGFWRDMAEAALIAIQCAGKE